MDIAGRQNAFSEWSESLGDLEARKIIHRRLIRLRRGNPGDCKYFESILELRIDYGPGCRIYCGRKKNTVVILLVGGAENRKKATSKRPNTSGPITKKRFPA